MQCVDPLECEHYLRHVSNRGYRTKLGRAAISSLIPANISGSVLLLRVPKVSMIPFDLRPNI